MTIPYAGSLLATLSIPVFQRSRFFPTDYSGHLLELSVPKSQMEGEGILIIGLIIATGERDRTGMALWPRDFRSD